MMTAYGMTIEELAYELRRNPKRRQLLELLYQSSLDDEVLEYLEDVFVRESIYLNDLREVVYSANSKREVYEIVKEYQREQ